MKKILLGFFLVLFLTPPAFAALGVGVGVGKIVVDEKLKPGQIYTLPSITVLNTGDEVSDYELGIEHHEDQKELVPKEEWFVFSPAEFKLEPGKVQPVKITLNLPINATPGDYFAYVEARPIKKAPDGTTSVNIAAATKLYFTIIPGSIFSGILHKLISFWNVAAPVPQIVLIAIILGSSVLLARRFINIEIKLSKRGVPKWILIGGAAIFIFAYLFFWIKFFEII